MGQGPGFSPAFICMIPGYFHGKQRENRTRRTSKLFSSPPTNYVCLETRNLSDSRLFILIKALANQQVLKRQLWKPRSFLLSWSWHFLHHHPLLVIQGRREKSVRKLKSGEKKLKDRVVYKMLTENLTLFFLHSSHNLYSSPVILLPCILHPASLKHKNPQRCKVNYLWYASIDRAEDVNVEYPVCDFCGCYCGYC